MNKLLSAVPIVGLSCLWIIASARGTEAEPVPPEVGRMTVDQLLGEFSASKHLESCPHTQRWVDIVSALRRQGEPLYQRLRANLQGPDEKLRLSAVYVLGQLGKRGIPMVPELLKAAADPSWEVRRAAIAVLGRLKDPRAFYTLIEAARDPLPAIRSIMIEAGPSLSDGQFAVAVLALSDKERGVRMQAARAVKMLKDPRAVPYLIPLLDDVEIVYYSGFPEGKVAERACDEAALALDYIVKDQYVHYGYEAPEARDRRVKDWQQWWKDNREQFLEKLYAEPDMVRSRE